MVLKVFKDIGLEQMEAVAHQILVYGKDLKIWTFTGNLGAGKTTMIKLIGKFLKIKDQIQSPTFAYVNHYDNLVYHFDCYRLKNIEESLDLGFEEYFDSDKICWVEWPEIIEPLLPVPYFNIDIEYTQENKRKITLKTIT